MKSLLSYLLPIGLLLSLIGTPVTAQVTTDGTTDTTVSADGNDFTIQDGDTAGSNLFHSFQDFSIPNGGSAFFDNAEAIKNIFSRVTGGNISNIDGLIRANDANLFLINPAGIIFGAGARLDLGGGSFYGSSADSILFEDGKFSATDLENPPLITVNAPIGLSFRDNPEAINNNSVADDVGLQVFPEETIALLGGDVNFPGGIINSAGVNIFLGGLSEAGTIDLDENLNPSFPADVAKANVSFSDSAFINVSGSEDNQDGGSIAIDANNINLDGAFFNSSTFGTGDAGNITLNADNNLDINASTLTTSVRESASGQGGQITLTGSSITLSEGSNIGTVTFANADNLNTEQVRGGDIELNVVDFLRITGDSALISSTSGVGDSGNITINGEGADIIFENDLPAGEENADDSISGSIFSSSIGSIGSAGDININARSLDIANSGTISSTAFGGEGNGGDINIRVAENFDLTDSTISSDAAFDLEGNVGTGNAGNLLIDAESLSLSNSSISSSTFGSGDAGNINIDVNSFSLSNGLGINNDTQGSGNSGNITINADNNLDVVNSIISSSVQQSASGQGGQITLTANSISLSENAVVGAVTFPDSEDIEAEQVSGGNVELNVAESLRISEGSSLTSQTGGKGDGGDVTINAEGADIVFEDNVVEGNENIVNSGSIFSSSLNGSGDAGDIIITTTSLTLRDAGFINSSAIGGTGDGGNITIDVAENIELANFSIASSTELSEEIVPTGNAGNININANSLSLLNKAILDNSTFGQGNAGSISLNIGDSINIDGGGSRISTSVAATATGSGGQVNIETQNLSLTNGGEILSQTFGAGQAGNIDINADNSVIISGVAQFPRIESDGLAGGFSSGLIASTESGASETGGEIAVVTSKLQLDNGGVINARSQSNFSGGNITVDADILEIDSGGQILTTALSSGSSGNINLNISDRVTINGSDTTFQTRVDSLTAEFDAEQARFTIDPVSAESGILANTLDGSTGNGGSISIGSGETGFTNEIALSDGGRIAADSQGSGNGGQVSIRADNLSLSEAEILAETTAEQPQDSSRSEINLFIDKTLTLRDNSVISAQASNNASGGNVNIDAGFVVAFPSTSGDGNDILASASDEGTGGDINIETRQIFGLEERQARVDNASNDIDASSEFGLDGNVTIAIFDPTAIEGATELPTNTVETEAVAANVCSADSIVAQGSSLTIQGKGGIPPEPTEPLSSDVINITESAANNDSETSDTESVSIDDIVPARGVKVTEAGQVILTAYPVDNQGDRLSNSTPNCS